MSETSSEEAEPVLKKSKSGKKASKKSPETTTRRANNKAKSKTKKTKKSVEPSVKASPKDSSSEHSTTSSETNEAEVLDEFIKREEEDFVDDASCLVSELQKAYSKVSNGLRKPNVLLTGITGSGKSSIINAVFGKNVAKTAAGYPVTQHFMKYQSDDMRVVIYDSKGLEHGEFEDFISTTQDFFDEHKVGDSGESADAIHVIWYIINCAHSRWEPFEERICRELFNKVPIIFILNKSDISTEEDRQRIRKIIEEMDLPNCVGVFDTVAVRSGPCQTIEECPYCGSDDLVIRKRTATAQCVSCKQTTCIKQKDGLSEVIATTCKFLPEVVREAFISAQTVSVQLKESSAHKVIEDFWEEYENVRTPSGLLKMIANMMARLSIIWEFKQHGQVYGELWARDLVSNLKWKDKFNLLFHKKMEQQRVHLSALGILWNKCIRSLAIGLLQEFTSNITTNITKEALISESNTINEGDNKLVKKVTPPLIDQTICSKFYRKFFMQLNEENLAAVEEDIRHIGLKALIASDTIGDISTSCLGNTTSITGLNTSGSLRGSGGNTFPEPKKKNSGLLVHETTGTTRAIPADLISINATPTTTLAHTTTPATSKSKTHTKKLSQIKVNGSNSSSSSASLLNSSLSSVPRPKSKKSEQD